jgi:prophage maintenance system killer protein
MDLLEAAAGRPMQSAFGQDAYPTPQEKAAALLHSIARNHPFADGNKRTATIAILFMLEVNGLCVKWDPAEALARIVELAEGKSALAELPRGCPSGMRRRRGRTPRPIVTIERIMADHRWLLEALAKR